MNSIASKAALPGTVGDSDDALMARVAPRETCALKLLADRHAELPPD